MAAAYSPKIRSRLWATSLRGQSVNEPRQIAPSLARVDAFEQLPEAALQAVVGFADVLQGQDRPRRGVQAAECAGHAGQGGEVAADQRAFDALLVSAEVLHREFMVDSGQQAADRGQRG